MAKAKKPQKMTSTKAGRLKRALGASKVVKPLVTKPGTAARWKWRRTNPLASATLKTFGRERAYTRTKSQYYYGPELREAIARGDIPAANQRGARAVRDPQAAAKILAAQRGSPLFIETLKRQLTGDRVGRTLPTDTEVRELIDLLSGVTPSKLTQLREGIAARLTQKSSWLRRQLSSGVIRGAKAIESVLDIAKSAIDKLVGADVLKKRLAGIDLNDKEATSRAERGYRSTTPYQSRRMVGVSSSNVASVGWEPHTQNEPPTQNTLGTLFIAFRNGWEYKYRDAPYWLFEALLRASSPGRAVWALIRRGLYPDGTPYGSMDVEGYQRIR